MNFDARQRLLLVLLATFITALIVGDLIGVKLLQLNVFELPFVISVGMIPFPITFLLTDLLNEFYGRRTAAFVSVVGFFMAVFAFTVIYIAVALPWAPFTREASWQGATEASFDTIFAGSQRILIASMIAYCVAQFTDIALFHVIKRWTSNRLLFLRATGSTAASQLVDTVVIQTIAWYGLLPVEKITSLVLTSYAVKLVVAIGLTPLVYLGHAMVERGLHISPVVLSPVAGGAVLEGHSSGEGRM